MLLEKGPENFRYMFARASALGALGKEVEAAVTLNLLRRMGQLSSSELVILGDLYHNLNLYELSLDAYQEALAGYGGIQHCLIPAPRHVIINKDLEGDFISKLFAEEQKNEDIQPLGLCCTTRRAENRIIYKQHPKGGDTSKKLRVTLLRSLLSFLRSHKGLLSRREGF